MSAAQRLLMGGVLAGLAFSANAALQGRNLDSNTATFEAYYDTALDITWLADWNYAKTSGFDTDGRMSWATAKAWAEGLDYYGVTGWRLPTFDANGYSNPALYSEDASTGAGYAPVGVGWGTASEMGHMYYVTLGNRGAVDPAWTVNPNPGPFTNYAPINPDFWTGSKFDTANAWYFQNNTGMQNPYGYVNTPRFAVAVHPGNVPSVPEPSTVLMMLAGLGALAMKGRRLAA